MNTRSINIANQLRGRKVLAEGGAEEMGALTDVVIDPLTGKMLGLIAQPKGGAPFYLAVAECSFAGEVIMASTTATRVSFSSSMIEGVRAYAEMLGTNVVTRDGQLLGCVSEIHLLPSHHFIVYRVTESRWQRLFGEGFFIAGDLPYAYSREGMRLIVPTQTERLYSFQTILDRVGSPELAWAGRVARPMTVSSSRNGAA